MGEARLKSRRREEILSTSPGCIFCAGEGAATTVDHVPPTAIFDGRQRPSGLEFPACKACNEGSRAIDLLVSFLSRVYPDAPSQIRLDESVRILQQLGRRRPDLVRELSPTFRQLKTARRLLGEGSGALNCRGPLVTACMESFAAKVGVALNFEMTRVLLPPDAGVYAWWATNTQFMEGSFPSAFTEALGEIRHLMQGSKTSRDQFAFKGAPVVDTLMTAHAAGFRGSFAIFAVVSPDSKELTRLLGTRDIRVVRPGWLRGAGEAGVK